MVYTRGASDDYDRWAKVTGDNGWSWNRLWSLTLRVRPQSFRFSFLDLTIPTSTA